jgi:hypothetical protein
MEHASKLLDTIIKAPLWFYFASVVVTVVPMLNLAIFTQVGLTSDIKFAGIPLAFYTLVSVALFVSSATARSYTVILDTITNIFDWLKWRRRLRALPDEARILLAIIQEDALTTIYYDPRSHAVSLLRDLGILEADLISERGDRWGIFKVTAPYTRACARHRPTVRSALRYSHDAAVPVRATIEKAYRAARSTS